MWSGMVVQAQRAFGRSFIFENNVVQQFVTFGNNVVLESDNHIERPSRRLHGAKAAMQAGVTIEESTQRGAYWDVLCERCATTYQARPVHALEEVITLNSVFPRNIRLFITNHDGRILAGVVVYETNQAARLEYIAAAEGGELCALDLLILHLLDVVNADKRFADFGPSNDASNDDVSLGLVDFKEGFGGRSVADDWYRIDLSLTNRP